MNQGGWTWSFFVDYTIRLRTISFLQIDFNWYSLNVTLPHANNWWDGISSRMYIRSPTRLLLRSNLNGALNSSILNWAERNTSSSFVSQIKRISMFLPIVFSENQIYSLTNWYLSEPRLICQVNSFSCPSVQFLLQWFCFKKHGESGLVG